MKVRSVLVKIEQMNWFNEQNNREVQLIFGEFGELRAIKNRVSARFADLVMIGPIFYYYHV